MDKYVAISIMCRDENEYLHEWIDYHSSIGVDHFYIFDNDSQTPISETLKQQVENGLVTVENIYGVGDKARQQRSQSEAVKKLTEYTWVGLLDTDEFVVLLDDSTNIKDYLKQYEIYGAVGLNWLLFGANGHEYKQESIIDSFTQSCPNNGANQHIKSFVRTKSFINKNHDPHFVHTIHGTVNVDLGAIEGPFNNPPILDRKMRINHYVTRSMEDYNEKRLRGPGDGNSEKKITKYSDDFFKAYNNEDVQNYDIIKLKERIDNENSSGNNNL